MQARDAVFLEDLCPKLRVRRWRQSLHLVTDRRCVYCGEPSEFPGWRRAVEYTPRALQILTEVFPPLLAAVRASPLPVFHVVGGRDY